MVRWGRPPRFRQGQGDRASGPSEHLLDAGTVTRQQRSKGTSENGVDALPSAGAPTSSLKNAVAAPRLLLGIRGGSRWLAAYRTEISYQLITEISHQLIAEISYQLIAEISHQLIAEISHQLIAEISYLLIAEIS